MDLLDSHVSTDISLQSYRDSRMDLLDSHISTDISSQSYTDSRMDLLDSHVSTDISSQSYTDSRMDLLDSHVSTDISSHSYVWYVQKTLKNWKNPPGIMLHMFDAMIKPIVVCGSDAWGTNKATHLAVNKVFLHFAWCTLCVKATTSNAIVFGETGHLPPSLSCMISALIFANRLYRMSSDKNGEKGLYWT